MEQSDKESYISSLMIHNDNFKKFYQLSLPEINLNFKVLSRLQDTTKLYIRENKFIEIDNSAIKPITRTIKNMLIDGYNRDDIIDFILFLTDQTISLTNKLANKNKDIILYEGDLNETIENLMMNIKQAIIGLNKLKIIYYNNDAIQTRLETVIETLTKRVIFLGNLLK